MRNLSWEGIVERYGEIIWKAADLHNVDPAIIAGVIMQESAGNPQAVSDCGARGLMQIMPMTGAEMGLVNPFDPADNIDKGTKYLAKIRRHRNVQDRTDYMLAAYNCGPARCRRKPWPAQTRDYVPKVLKYADEYRAFIISRLPNEPDPRKAEDTNTRKLNPGWMLYYWGLCKNTGGKNGGDNQ